MKKISLLNNNEEEKMPLNDSSNPNFSAISSVLKEDTLIDPKVFQVDSKASEDDMTNQKQSRNQCVVPEEKMVPVFSEGSEKPQESTTILADPGKTRKEKLKILFWRYAKVSDETGSIHLNTRQYVKLLKDSNILDNTKVSKSQAEVIFVSVSGRKGMTFDSFFQSLIKLSEIKYKATYLSDNAAALSKIVTEHLLPLYENPRENPSPHKLNISFDQLIYDSEIKIMLNSVYTTINDIYNWYFDEIGRAHV